MIHARTRWLLGLSFLAAIALFLIAQSDNSLRRGYIHRRIRHLVEDARKYPSDRKYAHYLLAMAQSPYSFDATNATVGLGQIGPAASYVLNDLAGLLKSPNPYVSREAARSLGPLGKVSTPVLPALEEAVENGDPSVDTTWFAAAAIGQIGKPALRSLPLLRSKLGLDRRLTFEVSEAIKRIEGDNE